MILKLIEQQLNGYPRQARSQGGSGGSIESPFNMIDCNYLLNYLLSRDSLRDALRLPSCLFYMSWLSSIQPKRHSKRSSSSRSSNIITKYFRSESQAANASGSKSSLSDNPVVILIGSDDDLTETEDTVSAKSTHSSRSTVASTKDTVVNTLPSSSGGSDSVASPSTSELSHMHSKTVSNKDTNTKSSAKAAEINDIGLVIQEGMSLEEVSRAVSALSPCQKYSLLTKHFKPDRGFLFPKIYSNGCNRSFQLSWLERYPWLVYSKEVDGGFCKYCSLFVKDRNSLSALVNCPFRKWVKVNKIVEGHKDTVYHKIAIECAVDFRQSINRPELSINARISTEIFNRIQENRHILKCCTNCILYCGRQCIALRGDRENLEKLDQNPGNFFVNA